MKRTNTHKINPNKNIFKKFCSENEFVQNLHDTVLIIIIYIDITKYYPSWSSAINAKIMNLLLFKKNKWQHNFYYSIWFKFANASKCSVEQYMGKFLPHSVFMFATQSNSLNLFTVVSSKKLSMLY